MEEKTTQVSAESIKHSIHKKKLTTLQKEESKISTFLLDHSLLREVIQYLGMLIAVLISAFSFAYGYRAFIAPSGTYALISGGASGISQIIVRIFQIFNFQGDETNLQSIIYFLVNVPLFVVAWIFIGKKFTILTFCNVILTSLFISSIPADWLNIVADVKGDFIARSLFAGILTGVSSGVAYLAGTSAGGIDIIAFSIAERKSTNVGKYSIIINVGIVLLYTIVNTIKNNGELNEITVALYTVVYFFTASKVVDVINTKNKKTELQINTDKGELSQMLLRSFPHGCTVVDAVGGYTGKPRKIIYMIVSSSEVKRVINFIKDIDSTCFVNVIHSHQVYGSFYVKPMK